MFGIASHEQLNALTIATNHAIADTGATSIFIMDSVTLSTNELQRTRCELFFLMGDKSSQRIRATLTDLDYLLF
jgi:hypothetical protein